MNELRGSRWAWLVFAVVLGVSACGRESDLEPAQVAGCYVMSWDPPADQQPWLFPDSLVLSLERYEQPPPWHDDPRGLMKVAPIHQRLSDTAWTWKQIYRDQMWWHIPRPDSVELGLGHDGAEFIGFTAALKEERLIGTAVWLNDYAFDTTFAMFATRIACP